MKCCLYIQRLYHQRLIFFLSLPCFQVRLAAFSRFFQQLLVRLLRSKLIESEDKFKWEAISASHSHKSKSTPPTDLEQKRCSFIQGHRKGEVSVGSGATAN